MAVSQTIQRSGLIRVNGADLYHEVRGSGPTVLFIQGATGDGLWFEPLAERLAHDFTVVLYDRRGNSRSPRPAGWTRTSVAEQADDAAGLIEALGLGPAAVFGTSGGGTILLELLARRPDLVRCALVHEPAILSALSHPEELMARFQTMMEEGMARAGAAGAMENFLRYYATEEVFGALTPEHRERALGNAELFLTIELEPFETHAPDVAAIRSSGVPVVVLQGDDSDRYADVPEEVAWISGKLDVPVTTAPGAHAGYWQHPDEWAAMLRPLLARMS